MAVSIMKSKNFLLLGLGLLSTISSALPSNTTLRPRKDYEPGDTLNRTVCFCTNSNDFTQVDTDPYHLEAFPPGHKVHISYKFEYYNHRIDHSFSLHVPKVCETTCPKETIYENEVCNGPNRLHPKRHIAKNACLDWKSQHEDWCHTWFVDVQPKGIKIHDWKFCYQFRGDSLSGHSGKHRDYWTFYKDKRGLPSKADWQGDEEQVEGICGPICNDMGMETVKSKTEVKIGLFSRVDYFHVSPSFPISDFALVMRMRPPGNKSFDGRRSSYRWLIMT
ncbi:MAG: hypothetical protein Q9222_003307 [Ikaeria aurantiellina]